MTNDVEKKTEKVNDDILEEERTRNVFDVIGDFFAKMLMGIFRFIFKDLPIKIWKIVSNVEQLKKLFKLLYSISRAIFFCLLWIFVVFWSWWFFLKEQFVRFWKGVWNMIVVAFTHSLEFIEANAGWIWMLLALCGSAYGLMRVTLRRRKNRKHADDAKLEEIHV